MDNNTTEHTISEARLQQLQAQYDRAIEAGEKDGEPAGYDYALNYADLVDLAKLEQADDDGIHNVVDRDFHPDWIDVRDSELDQDGYALGYWRAFRKAALEAYRNEVLARLRSDAE